MTETATKKRQVGRWWGLPALAESDMAWGARAILDTRCSPYALDILGDRQAGFFDDSAEGEAKFNEFSSFLNKTVLPWMRSAAGKYFLTSDTKVFVRHYEFNGKVIVAQMTPRASYGYMYIACSLVEADSELPAEDYAD